MAKKIIKKKKKRNQEEDNEVVHHEQRQRKTSNAGEIEELKLTSMLDVTFQLLIFFILTINFNVAEGVLPADLATGTGGKPTKEKKPPKKPVVIKIAEKSKDEVIIEVNGNNPTNFDELYKMLESWHVNSTGGFYEADNPIKISPQGRVKWTYVVEAFNSAIRAKYEAVQFAKPK